MCVLHIPCPPHTPITYSLSSPHTCRCAHLPTSSVETYIQTLAHMHLCNHTHTHSIQTAPPTTIPTPLPTPSPPLPLLRLVITNLTLHWSEDAACMCVWWVSCVVCACVSGHCSFCSGTIVYNHTASVANRGVKIPRSYGGAEAQVQRRATVVRDTATLHRSVRWPQDPGAMLRT